MEHAKWNEAMAAFSVAQGEAEASLGVLPPATLSAVFDAREARLIERAHDLGDAVLGRNASSVAEFADKLSVIVRQERGLDEVRAVLGEMRAALC
jgi:hypothetical protein